MAVPSLEVSHLASSASFYAAVLQPLGLHYLVPPGQQDSLALSARYGSKHRGVVLEICQSKHPLKPPRLSSVVLATPDQASISSVCASALQANPYPRAKRSLSQHEQPNALNPKEKRRQPNLSVDSRSTHATIYDLDGNRLVLSYEPQQYSSAPSGRNDLRHREEETSHGIDWISMPSVANMSRRDNQAINASSLDALSAVTGTTSSEHPDASTPRQRLGNLNANTVMGALLGVAAGAALTYGMVSTSRSEPPSRERPNEQCAPSPRRVTIPERPSVPRQRPTWHEDRKSHATMDVTVPRRLAYPDFQNLSLRKDAFAGDGDEEVDYKNPWTSPPRYLTQGSSGHTTGLIRTPSQISRSRPIHDGWAPSHVSSSRTGRASSNVSQSRSEQKPRALSRVSYARTHDNSWSPDQVSPPSLVDNNASVRSRQPSQAGSRRSSVRAHSATPAQRAAGPMSTHAAPDRSSNVSSRRSLVAGSVSSRTRPRRVSPHRSEFDEDTESFVSAQTHRTGTTARRSEPRRDELHQESWTTFSRAGGLTTRRSTRGHPSQMSDMGHARRIPLPMSGVGSSHHGWDAMDVPLPESGVGISHASWDDDLVSLAPSDSISCVGSRPSRRHRKREH